MKYFDMILVITQEDFYFFVLEEFSTDVDSKKSNSKYLVSVILEYISCILECRLQVTLGFLDFSRENFAINFSILSMLSTSPVSDNR